MKYKVMIAAAGGLEMEEQMAAENKKQFIRIRGANENNLKNLSVDIPRDKFGSYRPERFRQVFPCL